MHCCQCDHVKPWQNGMKSVAWLWLFINNVNVFTRAHAWMSIVLCIPCGNHLSCQCLFWHNQSLINLLAVLCSTVDVWELVWPTINSGIIHGCESLWMCACDQWPNALNHFSPSVAMQMLFIIDLESMFMRWCF